MSLCLKIHIIMVITYQTTRNGLDKVWKWCKWFRGDYVGQLKIIYVIDCQYQLKFHHYLLYSLSVSPTRHESTRIKLLLDQTKLIWYILEKLLFFNPKWYDIPPKNIGYKPEPKLKFVDLRKNPTDPNREEKLTWPNPKSSGF